MYHVCNRGVEKRRLFDGDDDYAVAEQLLLHAKRRHSVKLHAYCFMPNHWHLVVEQTEAGAVSAFVGSFTRAHAWYLRQRRESIGLGYVYQGRFRDFPLRNDAHVVRVMRYVERNALTAGLVALAEHWRYGSFFHRRFMTEFGQELLSDLSLPRDWPALVNASLSDQELAAIHASIRSGRALDERRPYASRSPKAAPTSPQWPPDGRFLA